MAWWADEKGAFELHWPSEVLLAACGLWCRTLSMAKVWSHKLKVKGMFLFLYNAVSVLGAAQSALHFTSWQTL